MAKGILQRDLRCGRVANRVAVALFTALTVVLVVSLLAGVSALASM